MNNIDAIFNFPVLTIALFEVSINSDFFTLDL